jgi:hypothetical protein
LVRKYIVMWILSTDIAYGAKNILNEYYLKGRKYIILWILPMSKEYIIWILPTGYKIYYVNITSKLENIYKKFVFMTRALMCKIQINCNGKINT